MRLSFLIISTLLSFSAIASDWKTPATELMSQSGKDEAATKKLESIKDLDAALTKALDAGGRDEQLALNTIRKMPRLSMVSTLISKSEKMDILESRTASYLVALLSLSSTSKGDEIMKFATKKIDMTSPKISASLRIALLSAMYLRSEQPSLKTMTELLDDVSYELRMKTMDVALASVKDARSYEPFLKKALHVSPFPVRLKALEQIKLFPKDLQSHYKSDIESCSKSDPDETVRESCKSFRF